MAWAMPLKHILIPASLAALLIAGCGGGNTTGDVAKSLQSGAAR